MKTFPKIIKECEIIFAKKNLNHTKTVAVTRKLDKLCDSKFIKINMK